MHRRSLFRLSASLALLGSGFGLAACGGGGGDATTEPAPTPSAPPPPPPPPPVLRTFAYVASQDFGNVSVFQIGDDGEFSPVQTADVGVGTTVGMVAIHPSGKFAYATEHVNGAIWTFSIDARTGRLQPVGSPEPVASLYRIFIHPSGKFAYATSTALDRLIRFDIETDTGLLRNPTTMDVGARPYCLAIHPSGEFLFLGAGNALTSFSIDEAGALTEINSVAAGTLPFFVLITPNNNFVVVSSADRSISTHSIDPIGAVSDAVSVASTGNSTFSMAIHPEGRFLYAANVDDDSITRYSIDPENGALAALSPSLFGLPGPLSLAFAGAGRWLYATNRTDNTVSRYEVQGAGALVASGPAVAVPRNPGEITIVGLFS